MKAFAQTYNTTYKYYRYNYRGSKTSLKYDFLTKQSDIILEKLKTLKQREIKVNEALTMISAQY